LTHTISILEARVGLAFHSRARAHYTTKRRAWEKRSRSGPTGL